VLLAKVTPCFENGKKAIALGLTNGIGFATSEVHVIRPDIRRLDRTYLKYLLCSGDFHAAGTASMTGAGGLRRVSEDAIRDFRLPIGDLESQNAIAHFLDRETSRIDQLIGAKEQQIVLLEEEHQAFVTNAVTVGLEQTELKESSLPWVPVFPQHWTLTRLKFVCSRIVDCLHETPEHMETGDFPSIRTADVGRGILLLDQAKRVSAEEYRYRVQRLEPGENDVVYTREGERYGLAALVPRDVKLCLGQRMMMFRANERVSPAFLMWSLNGELAYQWLKQSTAGATSPHLNILDIRNVPLFLPPKAEQDIIATTIDCRFKRKKAARKAVAASIDKLREFRLALITAAVSGQINVSTSRKRGMIDRRLDLIEEKMCA
jgi:type I restriction enzyme S subunit